MHINSAFRQGGNFVVWHPFHTGMTGLRHRDGALSMARRDPNTAKTEFFICVNDDQPQLDYGGKRTPMDMALQFSQVTKGMKVVRKTQQQETKMWDALGQPQLLVEPGKIISVTRKFKLISI